MNSNNHELCRMILSNIWHLRKNLKELEEKEPQLFEGDDPAIKSGWEFWSTDEILKNVEEDITTSLKESENIHCKELHSEIR
jgi:hypothetical protein